jgi:hypothetical protein
VVFEPDELVVRLCEKRIVVWCRVVLFSSSSFFWRSGVLSFCLVWFLVGHGAQYTYPTLG